MTARMRPRLRPRPGLLLVALLAARLPAFVDGALASIRGYRPALGRAGVAGAAALVVVLMALMTVWHEQSMAELGEDSKGFLVRLRQAYPELPQDGRLYAVNLPLALQLFEGDDFYLSHAVQLFYGWQLEVVNLPADKVAEVKASLEPAHVVFDYQPPPKSLKRRWSRFL